jgi:small subunit ribosomal protein S4e
VPYIVAHDGRTVRYPDPLIKAGDTVKFNLVKNKIESFVKLESGAMAIVTGGHNLGRIGSIEHKEKHNGGFDIIHLKDAIGNHFATRATNVFVLGKNQSLVSLPRQKGIRLNIIQERERRLRRKEKESAQ